jgi:hypothetical protein
METLLYDACGKQLPKQHCPVCGYELDAATCASDKVSRPKPGDVSICFKCANILVFDADMKLREPMSKEMIGIMEDETVALLVERLRKRREKK